MGHLGFIPELGRSPGEGKGYPLQYSGLKKSMNFIVHGVAKSWTRLSDFHFTLSPERGENEINGEDVLCPELGWRNRVVGNILGEA